MRYLCYFYSFSASLLSLAQAQGSNDGCITCALGDFFKGGFDYGLDNWILPASAGAAKLFTPDPSSSPDVTEPAQGFVDPQADPGKQRTNNLPGTTDQVDFELQVIGSPDAKCDPNGAGVSTLPALY